MKTTAILAASMIVAGLAATTAPAHADTWVYGPYYGPHGGRAGAVIYRNPYNGNVRAIGAVQGPNGRWAVSRGGVYHGPCATAWSRTARGPNGFVVRRGAVGHGCW
jgi:hypothetical protein